MFWLDLDPVHVCIRAAIQYVLKSEDFETNQRAIFTCFYSMDNDEVLAYLSATIEG